MEGIIVLALMLASLSYGVKVFKSSWAELLRDGDQEDTPEKSMNNSEPQHQPASYEPQKGHHVSSANLESDMTAAQGGNQKNKQLEELRKSLNVSSKKVTQEQQQKANQMKQKSGDTLVSPSSPGKVKRTKRYSSSIARFDHQSFVQSVVMKEVLGAPRAKKPYHPKYR